MKRYLLLFITYLLLITPVKAESKYLYDVLKDEAESGGVAKEYTREHQDTTNNTGTDKIYHYYAYNDETAEIANNKRNIIFGGYCWQMYRTTDSGGVRLLYNGTPYNGTCSGGYSTIGMSKYTTNDNIYKLGSVGYMYNELLNSSTYVRPNYGSFSFSGTAISESDYEVIKNENERTDTPPLIFRNENWLFSEELTNYSKIEFYFKVKNNDNYILSYNFIGESYDRLKIYVNDILIQTIGGSDSDNIDLINLKTTDTIKIILINNSTSFSFNLKKLNSISSDTRPYFGNDISYSNGTYTLIDTIRNGGKKEFGNYHYFCQDGSISCSIVYYSLQSTPEYNVRVIPLENGTNIEEYVHKSLYADDVNKYDSALKVTIDNWYEQNLINYQKYLEDTVFCQNRLFAYENNLFVPDGGDGPMWFYKDIKSDMTDEEKEQADNYNTNLKCENVTDRYSISNEKAKLKYPVATINLAETLLLNNNFNSGPYGQNIRAFYSASEYYNYWLLSPHGSGIQTYGWGAHSGGGIYYSYGSSTNGVRPVISLKKGTVYLSGDGSRNNPYVFDGIYSSINIKAVNETENINVEINDLEHVKNDEEVKFKVTPIEGYKIKDIKVVDNDNNEINFTETGNENEYMFIMPTSDVTIIPSYERVSNSIIVEDEFKEQIIIEVNDSSAVLYEDKVIIKVQEKDGYKIAGIKIIDEEGNEISYTPTGNDNEYEFIMPASNVKISPIYEVITVPDTEKNKDYTIYFVLAGLALILGIIYIIINKKKNP